MDDLLQEFIAETRETLEAISGEIVGWEAVPSDRGRLDAIFRFVHTIKGSCGFLDLPRLTRLSHAAEDALAAVRDGTRAPDAPLVTAILAIIDRIGEVVEAIDAGASLDDSGEDMLIAALDAAPPPGLIAIVDSMPDAPAAAAAAQPVRAAAKRTVRLSVDLLDHMMSGVSDMVLARNQLARGLREQGDPHLESMLERLTMTVDNLRDTVTRTRMQRIEALFAPLPRLVRDVAASLGKQVALTIEGGDVELDREMIELLRDPLVHLVRNAIDHGIEDSGVRRLAGKPGIGTLKLSARQAGNLIVIEIADDGAGIDTDRLVAKVTREQPGRARALSQLSESDRAALVFEPGLSSRDEATALSGRGVGMDVVKANVEQTGGRIQLVNRPGHGLAVVIEVPLTLAILNAVMISAAGQRFALPRPVVEEIVAIDQSSVRVDRFGGSAMVMVRGQRLPLVCLPNLLGRGWGTLRLLAVVTVRAGRYALALDDVTDTQELVVKPAAPAVMRAGLYAGQMLPNDGVPVLLLDVAGIAERAGLAFDSVKVETIEPTAAEGVRALMFDDMDGVRRLIPSDAVDRIERVAPGTISGAAGALWLTCGERSVPVWTGNGATVANDIHTVLRLQIDDRELAYPVECAIEMLPLPPDFTPAVSGAAVGITVVEGRPIELLDPLLLFCADGIAADPGGQPVCLLHGSESAWMEAFLRPSIENAGYRIARALAPGERAAVALTMAEEPTPPPAAATGPVIRLARTRGNGVYRYDRAALVAALQEVRA